MSSIGNHRETGGRVLTPKPGRDASDEVSQKAAENRKPPGDTGIVKQLAITTKAPGHSDGQQPFMKNRWKW